MNDKIWGSVVRWPSHREGQDGPSTFICWELFLSLKGGVESLEVKQSPFLPRHCERLAKQSHNS